MFIRSTLALLMLLLASAAQATTFDIHTDFSSTTNPLVPWTYGYSTTLGGTLNLYDQFSDTVVQQTWYSSVVNTLGAPADWNNATTANFHPGPGGEFSVYRFTAPSTGTFSLDASFLNFGGGGTDVHILKNGTAIYDHAVGLSTESYSNPSLSLTAGDKIDFAVGVGTDGTFFSDSTSIAARLTSVADGGASVPEPASLLLLGTGLLSAASRRRLRKVRRPRIGR